MKWPSRAENSIDPKIAEYRGRIIKTTGDGMLLEFASATDAVRCAIDIQQEMARLNAEVPDRRKMLFRAGINLSDVIVDDDDIYGDGVNVAARLETLASPGSICISGTVYKQLSGKVTHDIKDMGDQTLRFDRSGLEVGFLQATQVQPDLSPASSCCRFSRNRSVELSGHQFDQTRPDTFADERGKCSLQ